MNITIIGSGNVGSALAGGWHQAGHNVIFGVRDPDAARLKNKDENKHVINDIATAIAQSEVIVIATPADAVHDLTPFFKGAVDKVVIDTTNAVRVKPEGFATVYHALKALTNCQKLVKCFNSTGYENMADPQYFLPNPIEHEMHLDMFMAGDDENAKQVCSELAKNLGFEQCYDFGGSGKVELLEQFALCWINLAIMQRQGRDIGFKVIRRKITGSFHFQK
jgi:8-hydroxy-5-deazaflavin:NADPH oxidoreductase